MSGDTWDPGPPGYSYSVYTSESAILAAHTAWVRAQYNYPSAICYIRYPAPSTGGNGYLSCDKDVPGSTFYNVPYTFTKGTTTLSCPPDTTTTSPPCTCNDPYMPDPTATSCVVPPACPTHASGTPCACDSGYQFDATGTSCVDACPSVPALTPLPKDDACANVLENIHSTRAQKDAACGVLTDNLKTGMACFRDKLSRTNDIITGNPIPFVVTSDIRDIAYQAHFREIWDKMELLVTTMEDDPAMQTACAVRRAEIAAEKGCNNAGKCKGVCYIPSGTQRSHCLRGRPALPSPNDAQHTQGKAFDVSLDGTITPLQNVLNARRPPQNIQQFLDAPTNCGLIWGGTFIDNNDPVHFLAP
jgi:hypothetical protein